MHGIPDGQEADNQYRDKDQHDIFRMHADGVGIDDEIAAA